MKLKKLLCAITALTMSVSTFAGLTLSANAATVTQYGTVLNDTVTADETDGWTVTKTSGNSKQTFSLNTNDTKGSSTCYSLSIDTSSWGGYADYSLSSAKIDGTASYKITYDFAYFQEDTKGRHHYFKLIDSAGNDIVAFKVYGTKDANRICTYQIFDNDAEEIGLNHTNGLNNDTWYTMTAEVVVGTDGTKNLTASMKTLDGATTIWSESGVEYAYSDSDVNDTLGDIAALRFQSGDSIGKGYYDNIKVQIEKTYEPVLTTVNVSGDDSVDAGNSATYTSELLDQYSNTIDGTVTYSLAEETTGVSIDSSTGLLTTTDEAVTGTVTVVATAVSGEKTLTGEKTVSIIADAGYIITTNPYAVVTVDGTAYNSGNTGSIEFELTDLGEKSVTVSKSGYTSQTQTLTFALNETKDMTLTPTTDGVTYYEDFTNVTDGFGMTNATVTNGILYMGGSSGQTSSMSFAKSVSLNGRMVSLDIGEGNISKIIYVYLSGLCTIYLRMGEVVIQHDGSTYSQDTVADLTASVMRKVQLCVATDGTLTVYLDGEFLCNAGKVSTAATLTGIGYKASTSVTALLDNLIVTDIPATYTLTTVDGETTTTTTTTYLSGSTATLPAAAGTDSTFLGWTTDGTTLLAAGSTVTVSADTTYTAKYLSDVTGNDTLTTTVGRTSNGDDSTDTITFTTTYTGDDVTTVEGTTAHGYVFVNFDNLTSLDFGTEVSGAVTKKFPVPFNANDTSVGFESGESFAASITDVPTTATFGLYGIPYLTKSADTTIWGAPATYTAN